MRHMCMCACSRELVGLTGLTALDLSGNGIDDLPYGACAALFLCRIRVVRGCMGGWGRANESSAIAPQGAILLLLMGNPRCSVCMCVCVCAYVRVCMLKGDLPPALHPHQRIPPPPPTPLLLLVLLLLLLLLLALLLPQAWCLCPLCGGWTAPTTNWWRCQAGSRPCR